MEEKTRKIQQRTIESKEKIQNAAYELFCQKGLYHTKTKEIAKSAGVSVGNFYNYYKDKEEVYFELVKIYIITSEKILENLFKEISKIEKPDVNQIMENVVVYMDKQMERALSVNMFFSDNQVAHAKNPEYKTFSEQSGGKIIELLLHFFESCPYVIKRASYQVMAYMVFTMAENISVSVMFTQKTSFYEEYKDEMIRVILQYIFDTDWKRTNRIKKIEKGVEL